MSRILRATVLAVGVLLASLALTGVASAHVSVSSADATQGGYGVITFRVPTESDTAGTVGLRVQLPEETPFASVRTTPMPGWTANLTRVAVDPPVDNGGQEITEAVSVVTWTAGAGTRIGPGEYAEFSLSVGPFPEVDSLVFKAIQTYDDGSEVAWIEETVEGQGEPEYPAPVLALPAGSGTDEHGATAQSDPSDNATDDASGTAESDGSGTGLATTALVVGAAGLIAGVLGLGFGLRARRRTVEK